jgi:catechol 2,3-dioxygenase-like lactoylglutathione lyase family enzyme
MAHVRRFNHVGITVTDLDVVTAFFVTLGLEGEGRAFVEGEFLETVCGIPDSRTEIVMLKSPDEWSGTRRQRRQLARPDQGRVEYRVGALAGRRVRDDQRVS